MKENKYFRIYFNYLMVIESLTGLHSHFYVILKNILKLNYLLFSILQIVNIFINNIKKELFINYNI